MVCPTKALATDSRPVDRIDPISVGLTCTWA